MGCHNRELRTQRYGWRMDLELRHLRAFIAVVDEGSFTAAAATLQTSQASVSRAIGALERALGTPVLHRTSRDLSLTAAGTRILGHARRVLQDTAAITRAASQVPGEVRVGYAWAALGRHTTTAQQRWSFANPGSELRFVQHNTPTAGLAEGAADLAILRRPLEDDRFTAVAIGLEPRYAALARNDPLARRRSLTLADFDGLTIAVDAATGTTTPDLWPPHSGPGSIRNVQGVDEWLTLIAGGQAIGITPEATVHQHIRPGVAYRPVRDATPITVSLAWWRDSQPAHATALVGLASELYETAT